MWFLTLLMQWAVRATHLKLVLMFWELCGIYLSHYTRKFWEILFPDRMLPMAQDGITTVLLCGDRLVLDAYLLLQMVLALLDCQWEPDADLWPLDREHTCCCGTCEGRLDR